MDSESLAWVTLRAALLAVPMVALAAVLMAAPLPRSISLVTLQLFILGPVAPELCRAPPPSRP
eukprot:10620470-Alexandrium_andersonii.AAC.1